MTLAGSGSTTPPTWPRASPISPRPPNSNRPPPTPLPPTSTSTPSLKCLAAGCAHAAKHPPHLRAGFPSTLGTRDHLLRRGATEGTIASTLGLSSYQGRRRLSNSSPYENHGPRFPALRVKSAASLPLTSDRSFDSDEFLLRLLLAHYAYLTPVSPNNPHPARAPRPAPSPPSPVASLRQVLRCPRHHRRNLRAHPLRRRHPHLPTGHPSPHAGERVHPRPQYEQTYAGHRVARRPGAGSGQTSRLHPQSARLSHRRRRRSLAAGGRSRPGLR